jgi:hypothetical protein
MEFAILEPTDIGITIGHHDFPSSFEDKSSFVIDDNLTHVHRVIWKDYVTLSTTHILITEFQISKTIFQILITSSLTLLVLHNTFLRKPITPFPFKPHLLILIDTLPMSRIIPELPLIPSFDHPSSTSLPHKYLYSLPRGQLLDNGARVETELGEDDALGVVGRVVLQGVGFGGRSAGWLRDYELRTGNCGHLTHPV